MALVCAAFPAGVQFSGIDWAKLMQSSQGLPLHPSPGPVPCLCGVLWVPPPPRPRVQDLRPGRPLPASRRAYPNERMTASPLARYHSSSAENCPPDEDVFDAGRRTIRDQGQRSPRRAHSRFRSRTGPSRPSRVGPSRRRARRRLAGRGLPRGGRGDRRRGRTHFRRSRDDREGQGAAWSASASASGLGRSCSPTCILRPIPEQTRDLMQSGAICIAYETVTSPSGALPLLTPMSEVAGRLAPQVGAHALEKSQGGRGILLGGVPGVRAASVVIIGGGVSGTHAAAIAIGMGAQVTVVDRSADALRRLSAQFGNAISTVFSTRSAIAQLVKRRRSCHRRRADSGRCGTQARHPRNDRQHEQRRGGRRHCDRPGRLLRDVARDHSFRPHLRGRWRRPLLRCQHAGRGCPHVDIRSQQRDVAVRPGDRKTRAGARPCGRTGICWRGSTFVRARSRANPSRRLRISHSSILSSRSREHEQTGSRQRAHRKALHPRRCRSPTPQTGEVASARRWRNSSGSMATLRTVPPKSSTRTGAFS